MLAVYQDPVFLSKNIDLSIKPKNYKKYFDQFTIIYYLESWPRFFKKKGLNSPIYVLAIFEQMLSAGYWIKYSDYESTFCDFWKLLMNLPCTFSKTFFPCRIFTFHKDLETHKFWFAFNSSNSFHFKGSGLSKTFLKFTKIFPKTFCFCQTLFHENI